MTISRSCHCGQVAFRIDGDIPAPLTHCTCSSFPKRGLLHGYYRPEQFQLTDTRTFHVVYRWKTKLVAHRFCSACGCGTLSDSPAFESDGSWDKPTRRISINARLFDNFDAATVPIDVIDGENSW